MPAMRVSDACARLGNESPVAPRRLGRFHNAGKLGGERILLATKAPVGIDARADEDDAQQEAEDRPRADRCDHHV